MAQQPISEVMTHDPITVEATASLVDVARRMRDDDTGVILVVEGGALRGLVTDRDIVVRAVADGRDPASTQAGAILSERLVTLSPSETVERAVAAMREYGVRRLPVVEGDKPIGVVSLGDLAIERDEESALADISVAPPNT